MQHVAMGNFILVEDATDEKMSKGGLILPDGKEQADSKFSVIISISEKILREQAERGDKIPLAVGDKVYHAFHTGVYIKTEDDRKIRAINYEVITCVVKE